MRKFGLLLIFCITTANAASFVWITDTHIGSSEGSSGAQLLTQSLPMLTPRPDFVAVTGDCTEFGEEEHFAAYRRFVSEMKIPVLSVPGNHDTTWAPKSRWEELLGPRHFSMPCGGVQVIGIDSTLEMRGEGHMDFAEREWLGKTLSALPAKRPVILCWHQPLTGGRSLDYGSEAFITGLLRRFNIVAILTGHNHADGQQIIDGVPCFVSASPWGKDDACANIITVEANKITFEKLRLRTGLRKQFAHVDLPPAAKLPLPKLVEPSGQSVNGKTKVTVQVADATATGKCRWGGEDFVSMTREGEQLSATLPPPPLPGSQKLIIAVTTGDSTQWLYRDVTVPAAERRLLWEYGSNSEIRCTPLVVSDRVVYGNYAGDCAALEAKTGRALWRVRLPGPVRGRIAQQDKSVAFGTTTGHVCLVNLADGELVRDVNIGAPILTGVVASGDCLYLGTTAGEILCLRGGKIIWRTATGYLLDAAPLVTQGVVYAANWHNTVVALDAGTGQELWRTTVGSNRYYSPAAASPVRVGGTLFLVSPDTKLYALNAKTGALLRKAPAECYAALAASADAVYIRSLKSALDAYNEEGERLWSAPAAWGWDHSPSIPAVNSQSIYAAGKYGTVEAFARTDGAKLWGYRIAGDEIFASPACDNERVYCATLDGALVALQR